MNIQKHTQTLFYIFLVKGGILLLLFSGCYSFKNVSIPADLDYFYVEDFRLTTRNAPPNIQSDFTESLKNKIRNESSLELSQSDAQVIFEGTFSGYNVQALAPEPGESVALNRLNVSVTVTYTDLQNEDKNWTQTFREYAEFPSDEVLADVEDELLMSIFEQINELIFNKAFGDW